jgi:hypothetical protein
MSCWQRHAQNVLDALSNTVILIHGNIAYHSIFALQPLFMLSPAQDRAIFSSMGYSTAIWSSELFFLYFETATIWTWTQKSVTKMSDRRYGYPYPQNQGNHSLCILQLIVSFLCSSWNGKRTRMQGITTARRWWRRRSTPRRRDGREASSKDGN